MNMLSKCPFSRKNFSLGYQAHFEVLTKLSWMHKICMLLKDWGSRISYASFRNSWLIYKNKDLHSVLKLSSKKNSPLSPLNTFFGRKWIVKNPSILHLIFQQPRNSQEGLFHICEKKIACLDTIIRDLYPLEMTKVKNWKNEILKTVIFVAESSQAETLKEPILQFFRKCPFQEYRKKLNVITNNILDHFSYSENTVIDPRFIAGEYTLAVICTLFMNEPLKNFEYQKLSRALAIVNKRFNDAFVRRPQKKKDKLDYLEALPIIRNLIEDNINTSSPFIDELKKIGLSWIGMRTYLYYFYLLALESTSAALHTLLLQLGLRRDLQEKIRSELPDRKSVV